MWTSSIEDADRLSVKRPFGSMRQGTMDVEALMYGFRTVALGPPRQAGWGAGMPVDDCCSRRRRPTWA
jgi:hypothetical protein